MYPNPQRKYSDVLKELIGALVNGNYDGTPFESDIELLHADFTVYIWKGLF